MTAVIERERKYEIDAATTVPRLDGTAGVRSQEEPVEHVLDATYFDTTDFRLLRAGITVRRRTGGDEGWQLKLPVDSDAREEIHLPLGSEAGRVPGRLRRLVRAYTLGRDLVPIAHLRTDRFSYRLVGNDGRTRAVLTDDHVSGSAGGNARRDHWREIEVELDPDAEPESLDELDRAVTRAGAAPSRWPSKLRRMLGERFPRPGRAPKRPDTGVVVLRYLAEQFENLRRADLGVRLDVEDSVHQMRVSARKLRSALRTFRSVVPKTETAEIAAELKWLGSRLARARDVEVTQERLAKQLDAVPAELLLGPVRQFLTRHYGRVEAEVRAEAMDTLSGKRYRSLLRAIDALLADPPLTKRAHERPKPGLRKALRRAARRLGRAEAAARGLKGAERELALHEVRKKAKQARYAADAAKPTYGKKLRKWRKHVKAAQSTLGEHQDTVVARDALHRLAVAGFGEGQNTFVFGLLHGREEAAAAGHRKAFRKAWRKLKSGRRPGWLS